MDPALAFDEEEISRNKIINETIVEGKSDVQRFYEDKVIFITGGSGFIGKQLIEKLLRSCNVKKIYMLMRPQKQKSINDRISEIFEDMVYSVLKNLKPDFINKIVPVPGDVEKLNIGLNENDRSMLIEKVDKIFHIAATINFTETLKKSTFINVRGVREILNLGEACKHLKAFVHISTAYTLATYSRIGQDVNEHFYEALLNPEALIQFAETLDETKLNEMTPALIKDWPNTYVFTKRVAEDVIRLKEGKLPIAVIRPAIVVGAYREPSPGWIDKSAMFSASGFILGVALGIIRVTKARVGIKPSYIPVDFVNNAGIIAGYHTNNLWNEGQTKIKIHNVVNCRNAITLGYHMDTLLAEGMKIPTDKAFYYLLHICTPYKVIHFFLTWILHYIPGLIVDVILWLLGKEPMLTKIYKKFYKLNEVVAYYIMNDWKFKDDNLVEMYKSLSPADQIIYDCDIENVNWDRYMIMWFIGIRKYILKDGLKRTNYAVKRMTFFRIANYIVTLLYLYFLWKLLSFVWFVGRTTCSFLFISLSHLKY